MKVNSKEVYLVKIQPILEYVYSESIKSLMPYHGNFMFYTYARKMEIYGRIAYEDIFDGTVYYGVNEFYYQPGRMVVTYVSELHVDSKKIDIDILKKFKDDLNESLSENKGIGR